MTGLREHRFGSTIQSRSKSVSRVSLGVSGWLSQASTHAPTHGTHAKARFWLNHPITRDSAISAAHPTPSGWGCGREYRPCVSTGAALEREQLHELVKAAARRMYVSRRSLDELA